MPTQEIEFLKAESFFLPRKILGGCSVFFSRFWNFASAAQRESSRLSENQLPSRCFLVQPIQWTTCEMMLWLPCRAGALYFSKIYDKIRIYFPNKNFSYSLRRDKNAFKTFRCLLQWMLRGSQLTTPFLQSPPTRGRVQMGGDLKKFDSFSFGLVFNYLTFQFWIWLFCHFFALAPSSEGGGVVCYPHVLCNQTSFFLLGSGSGWSHATQRSGPPLRVVTFSCCAHTSAWEIQARFRIFSLDSPRICPWFNSCPLALLSRNHQCLSPFVLWGIIFPIGFSRIAFLTQ